MDPFLEPLWLFPILLKRARLCRVNRAGSEVGRVVRARFVRGLASSSLSSCRFRDGGFAETCSSWAGGSSACESSGEVCFLSMVKNEKKRETSFPDELVDKIGRLDVVAAYVWNFVRAMWLITRGRKV